MKQTPEKKPPTPKKETEEEESEYYDEDAEAEKERLRRLRMNNRRAHRGFSQAEISMMRWEPAPK